MRWRVARVVVATGRGTLRMALSKGTRGVGVRLRVLRVGRVSRVRHGEETR